MTATFYATDPDLVKVWEWVLEIPGARVFEAYSKPDCTNRFFEKIDQIEQAISSGIRDLSVWFETVGGEPRAEYVEFNAATQRKLRSNGRTVLHCPGKIGIGRDSPQNGCLAASSVGCWTEKGVRQRSIYSAEFIDQVNWKLLASIKSKITLAIARSSPAKLLSYPIMPDAFSQFESNQIELWNWGSACAHPSPIVQIK